MIPAGHLFRLLAVALERLPDHRIVLDDEGWQAMRAKYGDSGAGGILIEQDGATLTVRLADHEDRIVMADRVRASGGLLVDSPEFLFGVMPRDDEDGA